LPIPSPVREARLAEVRTLIAERSRQRDALLAEGRSVMAERQRQGAQG
jgi:hypothetical protein